MLHVIHFQIDMQFYFAILQARTVINMLSIQSVSKNYGRNRALQDATLSIPAGSCYGLVGPNGAGKSTLLKILSSIIQDYTGKVDMPKPEDIGYVPQEICLEQTLSAASNLHFFGRLYGLHGKELRQRTEQVLAEIGLSNRGKDKIIEFSGGMKRRINIGCALMHQPKLLIMDEPTVGIDPQSRKYIFDMIHQLMKKGCTIIYASHYMEEVETLCDHVAFIDHGKILQESSMDALLQKHATPAVFVKGQLSLPSKLAASENITEKNRGHLITTNQPLAMMDQILHHYKNDADKLEQLQFFQPKLEDVFFQLTGSALRDKSS